MNRVSVSSEGTLCVKHRKAFLIYETFRGWRFYVAAASMLDDNRIITNSDPSNPFYSFIINVENEPLIVIVSLRSMMLSFVPVKVNQ